ncbi:hypothetical protein IAQ61_012067 [Plenodomus lingam]|uniref:uncharacterized protein n=1 Tax=Leptosphaeria maculans TaxID=5022 RepID=UPI0033313081|nr:hypothetical protein IAQ61_012067 [Plenodomus lingam]
MPLPSDLTISRTKFDSREIDEETKKFNEGLIKIWKDGPRWYEVSASTYRTLRWEGKTPLPKLNHYNITVVSIGYRLAPEDPWPKGIEDCYDAAEWLVKNSKQEFGGELLFTGGESAGAHLALLTALHLLTTTPTFSFRALLLHFGCYDLSAFLPHAHNHTLSLVVDRDVMTSYVNALLPYTTESERRHPSISPFWTDLRQYSGRLPPALFTCGSEDPLLDDSVMMGAKWGMWGGATVVKIYTGAPHGFIGFARGTIRAVGEALDDMEVFIEENIGGL